MTDNAGQRRLLMAEGIELRAQAKALRDADRDEEALGLLERIWEINQQYRELLPEVIVARCPHTDTLVRWPIETMGLNAWYWSYLTTISRTPDELPPTWLAMAGAMRLVEPFEHPPFAVVPGPDVPFVVPRILKKRGIRAVLAEVPVGAHTGWAISYFGPELKHTKLVNLWGTNTYPVYEDGVWQGWDWDPPTVSKFDFDLASWLRSGKLLWIEPGDESGTLREGPADCPFVDLPGERKITVVRNGKIQRVEAFAGHGAG
jgi:hypothetical protein